MSDDRQAAVPLRIVPKVSGRAARASKAASSWRPWPGAGRIWLDRDGEPHHQIRRTIGGKKYQVSLPAKLSPAAASIMLERFLLDPEGFDPRGEVRPDPIYLDPELIKDFLTWSKHYAGKDEKGTSDKWRNSQRQHLAFWMEKLHGLDLRAGGPKAVDLGAHVLPALTKAGGKRVPSYRQRVVVLKTLYGWLRSTVHRLQPAEDPTFGRLKSPKSKSAQGEGASKVIPIKNVLAVVEWLRAQGQRPEVLQAIHNAAKQHLADVGLDKFQVKAVARVAGVSTSHIYYYFKDRDDLVASAKTGSCVGNGAWKPGGTRWPDMLLFLLATGWHVTELDRFMADGFIESIPEEGVQDPKVAGVAVVVCKKSKRGNKLRTRVSAEAHEIAERLVCTGGFSTAVFYKEVAKACAGAQVPPFQPGNMRHTLSTFAQNHGAPDAAIEAFLNHAGNAAVLLKYYSRGVALKVPTPL
jgi:hypothetical protein